MTQYDRDQWRSRSWQNGGRDNDSGWQSGPAHGEGWRYNQSGGYDEQSGNRGGASAPPSGRTPNWSGEPRGPGYWQQSSQPPTNWNDDTSGGYERGWSAGQDRSNWRSGGGWNDETSAGREYQQGWRGVPGTGAGTGWRDQPGWSPNAGQLRGGGRFATGPTPDRGWEADWRPSPDWRGNRGQPGFQRDFGGGYSSFGDWAEGGDGPAGSARQWDEGSWRDWEGRGRSFGSTGGAWGREIGRGAWGRETTGDWSMPGPHSGRGPRGYRRDDNRIREDINERLTHHGGIDASDIDVRVDNGEVTLEGSVANRHEKRWAEDIAEAVSGVNDVHNRIRVTNDRANRGRSFAGTGQPVGTGSSTGTATGGGTTRIDADSMRDDGTTDDRFRRLRPQFEQHFGQRAREVGGGPARTFDQAERNYRTGFEAAQNPRFNGRRFDEVETDLRRDYESRRSSDDLAWERLREEVREGFERARSV